jgi:hypothetical protein
MPVTAPKKISECSRLRMLSRQLNCEGKLHDSNPVPFATKNIHYSLTLSLAETENMVNARNKFAIKADRTRRFRPPWSVEHIGALTF